MHHAFGLALARAEASDDMKELVLQAGLRSPAEADGEVANAVMLALAHDGKLSLPALWDRALSEGWGDDALLRIARSLPTNGKTWEAVSAVSAELDDAYWRTMFVHGISSVSLMEAVAGRLIEAGRSRELVGWLAQHLKDAPSAKLLVQALEAAVREPTQGDGHSSTMLGHYVGLVFDRLRTDPEVSEDTLVRLEWMYFQVLRHSERPRLRFTAP